MTIGMIAAATATTTTRWSSIYHAMPCYTRCHHTATRGSLRILVMRLQHLMVVVLLVLVLVQTVGIRKIMKIMCLIMMILMMMILVVIYGGVRLWLLLLLLIATREMMMLRLRIALRIWRYGSRTCLA